MLGRRYVAPARNAALTALRPLPGNSTMELYTGPTPVCSMPLYRGEQPTCWQRQQVSSFFLDVALWGKSKPDNGSSVYSNGNWIYHVINTVSLGEVAATRQCLETLGVGE